MTIYDILALLFVLACGVLVYFLRQVIFGDGNDIIDAPTDRDTKHDRQWKTKKDDEFKYTELKLVPPLPKPTPTLLYDQETDTYI